MSDNIKHLREICTELQAKLDTVTQELDSKEVTTYKTCITGEGPYLKHLLDPFRCRICDLFTKMMAHRDPKIISSKRLQFESRVTIRGSLWADGEDISASTECDLSVQFSDGWASASFRLSLMPGCCKVVVSHMTHVDAKWRRQGWASLMMELKEVIARYIGATTLIATVKTDNTEENKCLLKHGWQTAMQIDTGKLALWTKVVS